MKSQVNPAIYELLELAKIKSPFSEQLITEFRRRLVNRLVSNKKIDTQTASYLLN